MIVTKQFCMCDVCRLVDYDCTRKECSYCGLCDAWICDADLNQWSRRMKAAIKRKLEPGYRGLSNYEEVAIQK